MKKSFSKLNESLKKEGYEPLTKESLMEIYSLLFSIDQNKIEEIAEDDSQPIAIRLILQEMTEPHSRAKALQDMRDFMFGKATNIENESKIIKNQFSWQQK